MPHFAPISPQVMTKRSWRGVMPVRAVLSVISVLTEIYDKTGRLSNGPDQAPAGTAAARPRAARYPAAPSATSADVSNSGANRCCQSGPYVAARGQPTFTTMNALHTTAAAFTAGPTAPAETTP